MILSPSSRFTKIEKFISNYFSNLSINGNNLFVSKESFSTNLQTFKIPYLEYNGGLVLDPYRKEKGVYNSGISNFPKARKNYISENGILDSRSFDRSFIFYPSTLDSKLVEEFQYQITKALKRIAPGFNEFILIKYNDERSSSAYRQLKSIGNTINANEITSGNCLWILPNSNKSNGTYQKRLHDSVKKEFFPNIRFQCLSASKLNTFLSVNTSPKGSLVYDIAYKQERRFQSYLTNLIFEFLIINRKWPYQLQQNLNYDIYIGIDAHDHFAGFSFFYKNGNHITFAYEKIAKRTGSFRNEKISHHVIKKVLVDNLKRHIPRHAINPNGIVILRDGLSFGEEEKALKLTIQELIADNIIPNSSLSTGVIDVRKDSSLPVRAACPVPRSNNLNNPKCGTYLKVHNNQAFIFNTGYPFETAGTSSPLLIGKVSGNVNFDNVLQDVFNQSILAFSAPERANHLPITLKIIDTLIRSFAHQNTKELLETNLEEKV